MKTNILIAFAVFALASCSKTEQKKEQTPVGEVVTKDLVCGMEGKSEIIQVHQGKTYQFCNEGCKEAFVKEPEKYLTANTETPTDSVKTETQDSSKKM